MTFDEQVAAITQTGLEWHRETLLRNSFRNAAHITRTIRDIAPNTAPALVVSAGPSLYRERILSRIGTFHGTIIATDGAYIQCLKAGITPDWVITLDPHPTRMVRWFGDPDFAENMKGDDYFARQDLDVAFRNSAADANAENIRLVDNHKTSLVIATTSPENVVARTQAFNRHWFVPLVDSPRIKGTLTRIMCAATGCPALNTGGTVGTAAWSFAHQVLKSPNIACVGMDFGYYKDTTLDKTQSWHMLGGDKAMYPTEQGHWGEAFTDPTYFWYRENFRDLLKAADARVTNCSGAGLFYGERVDCMDLETWLSNAN
jgi:hypothetical protein